MQRIALDTGVHPLSDFRRNVSRFIGQAHKTGRPVVITQHGRSSAVLMDVADYERMVEKFELIRDIEIATKQVEEGKGIPHEQARKRLKGRIPE